MGSEGEAGRDGKPQRNGPQPQKEVLDERNWDSSEFCAPLRRLRLASFSVPLRDDGSVFLSTRTWLRAIRQKPEVREMNQILTAALDYRERRLSVIPVSSTKKASRNWTDYQKRLPDEREIRDWFGAADDQLGVGIITGAVSGGLAVRNFDAEGSYDRWAAQYRSFAQTLPTVATGRGHHVYLRIAPGVLAEIRGQARKGKRGAIAIGDGEFRADVGCYVVAPPSKYPTGSHYRWVLPLSGEIPLIDPREAGLLACWTDTSPSTPIYRVYGVNGSDNYSVHSVEERVSGAIDRTMPTALGQRRARLFQFARELKAIEELASKAADDLKPYVKRWHERALPIIGTKPFEETWWDFCEAWEGVRFPAGGDILGVCLEEAKKLPLPKCAEMYEGAEIRQLVALCCGYSVPMASKRSSCRAEASASFLECTTVRVLRGFGGSSRMKS